MSESKNARYTYERETKWTQTKSKEKKSRYVAAGGGGVARKVTLFAQQGSSRREAKQ